MLPTVLDRTSRIECRTRLPIRLPWCLRRRGDPIIFCMTFCAML